MLHVVRSWFPNQSILLIGDGDYARVKLARPCVKLNMTLIKRLRADARLHGFSDAYTGNGRRKKRGKRLSKEDIPETSAKVQWYGGGTKEIAARMKKCIWYAGKPEVYLSVFADWVEFRKNDEFILQL